MKFPDRRQFLTAVKYGLAMGLSFCIYTLLMWITRLDTTYLSFGRYLDIAILILPIAMIFLAVRAARGSARITLFQRVSVALITGFFSFVVYAQVLYFYHHYINPTWFDAVIVLRQSELQAAGADVSTITAELASMRERQLANDGLLNGFIPSVIVLPVLISLLSLIFVRNPKKDRAENTARAVTLSEV